MVCKPVLDGFGFVNSEIVQDQEDPSDHGAANFFQQFQQLPEEKIVLLFADHVLDLTRSIIQGAGQILFLVLARRGNLDLSAF